MESFQHSSIPLFDPADRDSDEAQRRGPQYHVHDPISSVVMDMSHQSFVPIPNSNKPEQDIFGNQPVLAPLTPSSGSSIPNANLAGNTSPYRLSGMVSQADTRRLSDPYSQMTPPFATMPSNSAHLKVEDSPATSAEKHTAQQSEPPPWTETKTKAGKERKRLPLACIACRKKKVRCSGEKPACRHCCHTRIPCVYKAAPRKAGPRTDYMAMLDKRLKRMEERVMQAVPKVDNPAGETMVRADLKPGQQSLNASKTDPGQKRAADEAFITYHDPKTSSRSPEPMSSTASPGLPSVDEKLAARDSFSVLPPLPVQEYLVEVFFDNVYGQPFLLLHKPTLLRKLKTGAVPHVLLLAICAVSARFAEHPEITGEPAFLRGQPWADQATQIIFRKFDQPNISILVALVILSLHELGCCRGSRSWMFGGMAIRMAFALNLHKDLRDDEPSPGTAMETKSVDREVRRRLMWSCFLLDRFSSSGTVRPMFISEDWLQIQLPMNEDYFNMSIPGLTEGLVGGNTLPDQNESSTGDECKSAMGVEGFIVRIIRIWGLILQYSSAGRREVDPEPIWSPGSTFANLVRLVEDFKLGIPSQLTLVPENISRHRASRVSNQLLLMHIILHQCILYLNREAIPSSPQWRPDADMPKDFLNRSGKRAFEAATQITRILHISTHHRLVAPFSGYCAYLSGTIHIFGMYQRNENLRASSRRNLKINIDYLQRNRRYWGSFEFIRDNLKEIYSRFQTSSPHHQHDNIATSPSIHQFADWFDRYPDGFSKSEENASYDKEDPFSESTSDLQSFEKFFASLSTSESYSHKFPKRSEDRDLDFHVDSSSETKNLTPQVPNQKSLSDQGFAGHSVSAIPSASSPSMNLHEYVGSQLQTREENLGGKGYLGGESDGYQQNAGAPVFSTFGPQFVSQHPLYPQADQSIMYQSSEDARPPPSSHSNFFTVDTFESAGWLQPHDQSWIPR